MLQPRKYMHKPISEDPPSEKDLQQSQELLNYMRESCLFENHEMAVKRERVLADLARLAKDWIFLVHDRKGLTDQITMDNCMLLLTFGSYRLGVHLPGADMDVLCVAPRNVEREEFFTEFHEILADHQNVTELQAVADAAVPILTFAYDDIPIDLAFCRLPYPCIPDDFKLQEDRHLKNMDDKSIISINGPRVTDEVLNCVPNKETFSIVMRCLKMWAKRRGVYANVVGFLGGIALEILLAKVCQLYPNAAPSTTFLKFFFFYTQWDWRNPILLKDLVPDTCNLNRPSWDPRVNPKDKWHVMPIITPSYPCQNSTYSASLSTLKVMKDEFRRGHECMEKILKGEAGWPSLFEPFFFFKQYTTYLRIDAVAADGDDSEKWSGWIRSRLRILVGNLERSKTAYIGIAHPCVDDFTVPDEAEPTSATEQAAKMKTKCFFVGLEFKDDLYGQCKTCKTECIKYTFVPEKKACQCGHINIKHVTKSPDLSVPVEEFCRLVEDKCPNRTGTMTITISPITRKNIPEYVLETVKHRAASSQEFGKKHKIEDETETLGEVAAEDSLERPAKRRPEGEAEMKTGDKMVDNNNGEEDAVMTDDPDALKLAASTQLIESIEQLEKQAAEKSSDVATPARSATALASVASPPPPPPPSATAPPASITSPASATAPPPSSTTTSPAASTIPQSTTTTTAAAPLIITSTSGDPSKRPTVVRIPVASALAPTTATTLSADGLSRPLLKVKLEREQEFRFDVKDEFSVTLLGGKAEVFGAEMASGMKYTFPAKVKSAVFTWFGCELQVEGNAETYVGQDTSHMKAYLNVHDYLQFFRQKAKVENKVGPRVLVVGSQSCGKTSICRILVNYAVRLGEKPLLADTDVNMGTISIPGTIAAKMVERPIQPGDGFSYDENPLVFFFGNDTPSANTDRFKQLIEIFSETLDARAKSGSDLAYASSGVIIDTFAHCDKNSDCSLLASVAKTMKADLVLVVDNEKLHSELSRELAGSGDINVVGIPRPTGVVSIPANDPLRLTMKKEQILAYFYGNKAMKLAPRSQMVSLADISIHQIGSANRVPIEALPIGATPTAAEIGVTSVIPNKGLQTRIMAVLNAPDNAKPEELLRASTLSFVHVTGVDPPIRATKTSAGMPGAMSIMKPSPAPLPSRHLMNGSVKFFES